MSPELDDRRAWFRTYFESSNAMVRRSRPKRTWYTCPVCGYPTLSEPGGFQICFVCWWEDDGQDDSDADRVAGGPNGNESLTEARARFAARQTWHELGGEKAQRGAQSGERLLAEVLVAVFEAIRRLDYTDHHRIAKLWRIASELSGTAYTGPRSSSDQDK